MSPASLLVTAVLAPGSVLNTGEGAGQAMAAILRPHLVRALPPVLYEARPGWGHQKRAFGGVRWRGVRPEVWHAEKNDGTWRHIRITAGNPNESLGLHIRDIQHPEPGRTTFTVAMSLLARLDFTQQNWKAGLKLFDGSIRARFRVLLTLRCELNARLESDKLPPECVVRVRVLNADLGYDLLVVEHIAGIGGEVAQVMGKAIHDGLRKWRPSLQENLLAKANAAIVKAGDTGEIRLGWQALLDPKQALATRRQRP